MRHPNIVRSLVIGGVLLAATSAFAQNKPATVSDPPAADAPDQASLVVGALQLGASPNLVISGMDISVERNSVVYSYYLKNTGSAELGLTATVSLPDLQASGDGSETWLLASTDPENPIGLSVTAGGAPVQTKAEVRVTALGLDRTAEMKTEHLPLIPFGPAVDKALAALPPDATDRLAALGMVSPRDPADAKAPLIADWTLSVVRSWQMVLPPGKTTPVLIKFTPVVAQYTLAKGDQDTIDEIKEDICLQGPALNAVQARLKGIGGWKVTDLSLAPDAPTTWNDTANATLSVKKPTPDSIVAFCGKDDKTTAKPVVLGEAPDDSEQVRIVIFEPMK